MKYSLVREEIYYLMSQMNVSKLLLTEAVELLGVHRSSIMGAMEACEWGSIAMLSSENKFERDRLYIVKW